ncbi:MAG: DMT family transporter [Sphingomonas sp.]
MHQPSPSIKTVAPQNAGSPRPSAHRLAFAALLVANVALAFGSWFVRLADTGPVASGFWRIALATPVLLGLSLASGWRPQRAGRGLLMAFVLAGFCFAADLGSWHVGILKTTLANATLFGNSAILFFPIYGFLAIRAWPSRTQGIALALAAIGAALLMGRSYQLNPNHLLGDMLCLFAGLLYTVYFIFMSRVRRAMAPLPALALATAASILPLLALSLLMGERIWPHDWTPLIALALVSQVFGQTLLIYALGQLPPLVVGIALLVQPVVAASVGWIVYSERLGAADLIGAGLVAIALVLVRQTPALARVDGETR